MSNDLISRSAVIAIIEKKRLMVGKHDLSAEYKLAGVQEEIERLPVYDVDKVVEQMYAECWCEEDLEETYNGIRSMSAMCLKRRAEEIGLDPDTVGY